MAPSIKTTIAIDGPVASGKTAVGQMAARLLRFRFLDTGAMYRAVTWAALTRSIDLADEAAMATLATSLDLKLVESDGSDRLEIDGQDITDQLKNPDVERTVPLVARISLIRTVMVSQQQYIAKKSPIVMVGRDIGTVVLPDAPIKVFLRASVEIRARRRYLELKATGSNTEQQQVADDLMRRDSIDSLRADSPLRPAADALQIDTDNLGTEEVASRIVSLAKER